MLILAGGILWSFLTSIHLFLSETQEIKEMPPVRLGGEGDMVHR